MVKQKSYAEADRSMNEYKMRTSHGGSTYNYRQSPSQHNHVQVAHSSGCCSSKKTKTTSPSQSVVTQQQTPRQTAHERSHSRLDSPDPFYHHHGKIKKNRRTKTTHQQHNGRNKVHSTGRTTSVRQPNYTYHPQQASVPTKKKESSCCTIL